MITDLLVQQIESCLPYEPNREQSELLQQLAAFVLDGRDDSLFLLRGYAGTGKTSLVGALVKALTQLQSKVVLLAPTGRAAKVFSRYARHPAYTIHRRIYRQKSYSPDMEGFLIGENLAKHTLFIVDEASMIANSVVGLWFREAARRFGRVCLFRRALSVDFVGRYRTAASGGSRA